MSVWNLADVLPLILESGRLGLSYFDYPVKEYKADDSIVTLADKAIEDYLTAQLNRPETGWYVLGEETIDRQSEAYLAEAFRRTAWIIDPIDGTAPFANNLPTWGVSIGLMEQGILTQGAIFLAALGELYYTEGGVTYREKLGTEPSLWAGRLGQRQALVPPASPEIPRGTMIALSQQVARFGRYDLPFYVQVTGSSVFNMTRLAAGSYGAFICKFKIWDFAAGLPMLANLGWTMILLGSGEAMPLVMDARALVLEPGHPERWATWDQVVFAPSRAAADQVRAAITFPT